MPPAVASITEPEPLQPSPPPVIETERPRPLAPAPPEATAKPPTDVCTNKPIPYTLTQCNVAHFIRAFRQKTNSSFMLVSFSCFRAYTTATYRPTPSPTPMAKQEPLPLLYAPALLLLSDSCAFCSAAVLAGQRLHPSQRSSRSASSCSLPLPCPRV